MTGGGEEDARKTGVECGVGKADNGNEKREGMGVGWDVESTRDAQRKEKREARAEGAEREKEGGTEVP